MPGFKKKKGTPKEIQWNKHYDPEEEDKDFSVKPADPDAVPAHQYDPEEKDKDFGPKPSIPEPPADTNKQINAQKIVIIGSGPFALAEAIALKHKSNGLLDVTIVGPRLGEYSRSGDLTPDLYVNSINDLIKPNIFIEQRGKHIKDLENHLDKLVSERGIHLIKQEFVDYIDNKTIQIKDKSGKTTALHADFVYDCTGTARVCLNAVNARHKDTFESQAIAGNPHNAYAQLRVIMTNEEFSVFKRLANPKFSPDPLVYALVMEELREMGWKDFCIPECYGNRYPKKKPDVTRPGEYIDDENLIKVNIYTPVPEGMVSPSDIEKFVTILLKLAANDPKFSSNPTLRLHQEAKADASKSKKHKPMITGFKVEPQQTSTAFYLGDDNIPPTVHLGDATLNLPVYMGKSIAYGANRAVAANEALVIKDNVLVCLNEKQYQESFQSIRVKQESDIVEAFNKRKNSMLSGNIKAAKYYIDAYRKASNVSDKRKIMKGLEILDPLFVCGDTVMLSVLLNRKREPDAVENLLISAALPSSDLQNNIGLYQQAMLHDALEQIAEFAKETAVRYHQNNIKKAIIFYEMALKVLESRTQADTEDLIFLYANLVILQKDDPKMVVELADKVKNYLPLPALDDSEKTERINKLLTKIDYHKNKAMEKTTSSEAEKSSEPLHHPFGG